MQPDASLQNEVRLKVTGEAYVQADTVRPKRSPNAMQTLIFISVLLVT